ncbi:hypothetical protein TNCV_1140751 [Trichonephila clavipes]|nr:hypothetical protein TNCV_1140751 [Trichonephila clavipes]
MRGWGNEEESGNKTFPLRIPVLVSFCETSTVERYMAENRRGIQSKRKEQKILKLEANERESRIEAGEKKKEKNLWGRGVVQPSNGCLFQ